MAKFLGTLCADEIGYCNGRAVHKLLRTLIWEHDGKRIEIPEGFETDLASVPRLPIAFWLWGDRAHREGVLHDFLYRSDASIVQGKIRVHGVQKEEADWLFREAMIGQDVSWFVYHPMYLAVRMAGGSSYHCMKVMDHFQIEG